MDRDSYRIATEKLNKLADGTKAVVSSIIDDESHLGAQFISDLMYHFGSKYDGAFDTFLEFTLDYYFQRHIDNGILPSIYKILSILKDHKHTVSKPFKWLDGSYNVYYVKAKSKYDQHLDVLVCKSNSKYDKFPFIVVIEENAAFINLYARKIWNRRKISNTLRDCIIHPTVKFYRDHKFQPWSNPNRVTGFYGDARDQGHILTSKMYKSIGTYDIPGKTDKVIWNVSDSVKWCRDIKYLLQCLYYEYD